MRTKLQTGKLPDEPASLPNGGGKKSKSSVNGSGSTNGLGSSRVLADDDPNAQLELEMRQARQNQDVDMSG